MSGRCTETFTGGTLAGPFLATGGIEDEQGFVHYIGATKHLTGTGKYRHAALARGAVFIINCLAAVGGGPPVSCAAGGPLTGVH